MTSEPLLEAREISKTFAQTRALVGANLTLRAGATHALLGANGAGKSTLSRVISGHVACDSGLIRYRGAPLDARSPREALDAGIAMVMQETSLAPDLSVLENIFLPDLGRPGRLSRASMRRRADDILADLGQARALSLDAEARELSAAQRQLVEIAKALALKANLIIFDEPTASLSPSEVERLFDVIARLKSAQCAIVFVSHRLEEVFAVSDEITVMREGRTVAASVATSTLNQTELVRLMVGRELGAIYAARATPAARGEPLLSVRGLKAPPLVRDVSFDLHPGEILGLGGLVGAPVDPKPSRRFSGCVRAPAGRCFSKANRSRRARLRRRSAPGLALSPRIAGASRSCRICRFARICCSVISARIADLASATPSASAGSSS